MLQQYCGENDVPMLPALHPLAVGDRVLMRTSQTLWAIDINTGKRCGRCHSAARPSGNPPAKVAMKATKATLYRLRGRAGGLARGISRLAGFRLWHAEQRWPLGFQSGRRGLPQ